MIEIKKIDGFFLYLGKSWREKLKNCFLGQNNIYTSSGKREFTSLLTV
jgi:hypothetical protein